MDAAIQLNHKTRRVTIEVRDKSADDLLPTEVQARQLSPPEALPQEILFPCRLSPEFPSARQLGRIDALLRDQAGNSCLSAD